MMKNGLIIDRGKPSDLIKKHGRKNQIEGEVSISIRLPPYLSSLNNV